MKKSLFLLLVCSLCMVISADAQLFDRLKKRTKEKLEDKVEDKLVEELSEEIARRAFRPIDKAMDDMLRSSYEEQEGEEVDWDKAGQAYADFLAGMNSAANVPASYSFDIDLKVEIKDGEKDKHYATYYFSKENGVMGIRQEQEEENNLVVIDSDNDIIILYTEEDGKKKAQAIPSAMKLAGSIVKMNDDEVLNKEYEVKKTGKSKTYAGYDCDEYKIKSEEDEMKLFVAEKFPISFKATYGSMAKNFLPENYNKSMAKIDDGMIMYSEYKSKENKKYNSTYEVKKVSEISMKINNADYGLSEDE